MRCGVLPTATARRYLSSGHLHQTPLGPEAVTSYGAAQLVAQLAVPDAEHLSFGPDSRLPEQLLVQPDESYAGPRCADGKWFVEEGGPQRLWQQIEAAMGDWHAAGEPGIETFRVTVSPDEQRVHIPGGKSWRLPTN